MVATLILLPAAAEAQVQSGTTAPPPPLLIPLEPPENLPASGTEGGYLFNLRPLGADLGRALADEGIYIVSKDLSEGLANVSGGRKQGASFEGYTTFGFDFDHALPLECAQCTSHPNQLRNGFDSFDFKTASACTRNVQKVGHTSTNKEWITMAKAHKHATYT